MAVQVEEVLQKRVSVCGKSGDVRGDTVTSKKERLLKILNGYDKRDVFNLDEMGCYGEYYPIMERGKQCKGAKRSKSRALHLW